MGDLTIKCQVDTKGWSEEERHLFEAFMEPYQQLVDFERANKKLLGRLILSAGQKELPVFRLRRADGKLRVIVALEREHETAKLVVLEVLWRHEYQHSRVLRGLPLPAEATAEEEPVENHIWLVGRNEAAPVIQLNHKQAEVYQQVENQAAAQHLVLLGPAGSGKTLLMLERIKLWQLAKMRGLIIVPSKKLKAYYEAQFHADEAYKPTMMTMVEYLEAWGTVVPTDKKIFDYQAFMVWYKVLQDRYKGIAHAARPPFPPIGLARLYSEITQQLLSRVDGFTVDAYTQLPMTASMVLPESRPGVFWVFEQLKTYLHAQAGRYVSLPMACMQLQREAMSTTMVPPHLKFDAVGIDECQLLPTPFITAALMVSTSEVHGHPYMLAGDFNQAHEHRTVLAIQHIKEGLADRGSISEMQVQCMLVNHRSSVTVCKLAHRLLTIKADLFGHDSRENCYGVEAAEEAPLGAVVEAEVSVELLASIAEDNEAMIIVPNEEIGAKLIETYKQMRARIKQIDPNLGRPDLINLYTLEEIAGLEKGRVFVYGLTPSQHEAIRALSAHYETEPLPGEQVSPKYHRGKGVSKLQGHEQKNTGVEYVLEALYLMVTRAKLQFTWLSDQHAPKQSFISKCLELDKKAVADADLKPQTKAKTPPNPLAWLKDAKTSMEEGQRDRAWSYLTSQQVWGDHTQVIKAWFESLSAVSFEQRWEFAEQVITQGQVKQLGAVLTEPMTMTLDEARQRLNRPVAKPQALNVTALAVALPTKQAAATPAIQSPEQRIKEIEAFLLKVALMNRKRHKKPAEEPAQEVTKASLINSYFELAGLFIQLYKKSKALIHLKKAIEQCDCALSYDKSVLKTWIRLLMCYKEYADREETNKLEFEAVRKKLDECIQHAMALLNGSDAKACEGLDGLDADEVKFFVDKVVASDPNTDTVPSSRLASSNLTVLLSQIDARKVRFDEQKANVQACMENLDRHPNRERMKVLTPPTYMALQKIDLQIKRLPEAIESVLHLKKVAVLKKELPDIQIRDFVELKPLNPKERSIHELILEEITLAINKKGVPVNSKEILLDKLESNVLLGHFEAAWEPLYNFITHYPPTSQLQNYRFLIPGIQCLLHNDVEEAQWVKSTLSGYYRQLVQEGAGGPDRDEIYFTYGLIQLDILICEDVNAYFGVEGKTLNEKMVMINDIITRAEKSKRLALYVKENFYRVREQLNLQLDPTDQKSIEAVRLWANQGNEAAIKALIQHYLIGDRPQYQAVLDLCTPSVMKRAADVKRPYFATRCTFAAFHLGQIELARAYAQEAYRIGGDAVIERLYSGFHDWVKLHELFKSKSAESLRTQSMFASASSIVPPDTPAAEIDLERAQKVG